MGVIHWHDILQDLLDEHLHDLCGMKVKYASRELEKKVRYDYYCELDPSERVADDVYRPLEHMRHFNVIEFKSYHETFTSQSFCEYMGRLFQILGGGPKKSRKAWQDRWGEVTLTIMLARYPRAFFGDCKKRNLEICQQRPWLYRVNLHEDLHVYVMVLPGLRKKDLGYPTALLQALEHDPEYQNDAWQKYAESEEDYANKMKRIIMKINEEGFMTYLERVQKEIEQHQQKLLEAEKEIAAYKQEAAVHKQEAAVHKQEAAVHKQEAAAKDRIIEKLKEQLAKLTGQSGDLSFT